MPENLPIQAQPSGGSGSGSGSAFPLNPSTNPNANMLPLPHPLSHGPDPGVLAREAVADVMFRNAPDMRAGGKEGLAQTVAGLLAVSVWF